MKKNLLLFFLFSINITAKAQNLVPNGDFEQYSGCPNGFSQLDSALFWFNPTVGGGSGGSPDYFNQCALSTVGIPQNYFGYQQPHSGVAYSGIICTWYVTYLNYREYIENTLSSPLIANACYHFQMYVSICNECELTTDDLGVYFSNAAISGITNWNALPYIPQLTNTNGNITDTLNWTLISGNYTATGGEQYLIIGNFSDSINTSTIINNSNGSLPYVYFYIDDVSLSPCTGIEEQNENDGIKIYPNPVKDWLNVQISNTTFQNKKAEIKITDVLGKEILRKQFSNSKIQFSTSNLQSGIYFIEINDGKNIFRKKFLKL